MTGALIMAGGFLVMAGIALIAGAVIPAVLDRMDS
jgi:hypothetical protein